MSSTTTDFCEEQLSTRTSSSLYQNYLDRRPHPAAQGIISWWHKRLLQRFFRIGEMDPSPSLRVLEIGPGHGQFAQACKSLDLDYEFTDISEPVYSMMTERGFKGTLGGINLKKDGLHRGFDLIWLSHVLEHSPTWESARALLADLVPLLSPKGKIVVIGPDLLDWKMNFFDGDATHGFPTTIRNVAQLFSDVGLDVIDARHHRGGFFSPLPKVFFKATTMLPYRTLDRIFSGNRAKTGHGYLYSWNTVFGWRQIWVVGQRAQCN